MFRTAPALASRLTSPRSTRWIFGTDGDEIGGGIVGLSLALHLRHLGVSDVALLERNEPGFGSTGSAAGGIRRQFGTRLEIEMTLASWRFYERVLSDPDYAGGFERVGYVVLAGAQQVAQLKRAWAVQRELHIPVRWLEPEDLTELSPFCDVQGLAGGTLSPDDGFLNPWQVVQWLLRECRAHGVTVCRHAPVDGIEVSSGCVRAVRSRNAKLPCDIVVNAAGAWAGQVGGFAGVRIPVEPSPRVKFVAGWADHRPPDSPLIVDLPTGAYVRWERGHATVGVKPDKRIVSFSLDFEQRHLAWMAERACERFPSLRHAEVRNLIKGLYELTPDGLPVAGAIPGIAGFYVAAGFNGHGIMHGPGVTRALAELITMGRCEALDLNPLRPNRFDGQDLDLFNLL